MRQTRRFWAHGRFGGEGNVKGEDKRKHQGGEEKEIKVASIF